MPDKYKYYITTRLGTRQVNPLGKLELSYDNSPQDFRRGYAKSFGGKITFAGEDFNWLYTLEHSNYRCEAVSISISKYCNGAYVPNWQTGKIVFNKATWNLDLCTVEVQLEVEDKYTCFEAHKDIEINVLDHASHTEIVTLSGGTIEKTTVSGMAPVNPDITKWSLFHDTITYKTPPASPTGRNEVAEFATCHLDGGGQRPALLYNPVYTNTNDGAGTTTYETTYSIYTSSISIDNGMKLKDVFQAFLTQFCTGITLKSDFFRWGVPDAAPHINYVTNDISKVENLILFQKSDVKRPAVSGNATVGNLTFEKLLKNICTIFNCLWDIEDDGATFRIEHYSYPGWAGTPGLDLTQPLYKPYTALKRKYSYQVDSMPKFEKFRFMESAGQDFNGTDIWYDSTCVTTDEANKNKEYEADIITTDVALVMANPDADSKIVSDEGFVLVACYADNVIITEAPRLTSEYRINNSLAWAQLHNDYYRHGRILKRGYLNRLEIDFESSINTKLQEKLTVPACCGDAFNPDDIVITSLGNGQVNKATYNLATDMLELELLFNANDGLYVNHAPSASGINVVCSENSHVDIDISSHVSDADGDIDLSAIGFFSNSFINGTAVMLSPGIIRYTPDTGFTGAAYFYYYVKDRFNEPSGDAMINVNVTAIATTVNDAYVTFANEAITIAAPGVLANDAGTGLTITGYDLSSAHGGTVVVNSDGSFTYTPATGYTGSDSFTYTVTDGAGNTATGTVTIDVRVRQMVYVKLVQTVIETHPIPFGTGCTTPDYRSKQQLSSIVAYYYSNSAGTLPFNINHYNLTIQYSRSTVTNYPSPGTPTVVNNSFVTTSGTSQAVFASVETHRALYDCHSGAYGGTDFTDTYSLTTGTGYTII